MRLLPLGGPRLVLYRTLGPPREMRLRSLAAFVSGLLILGISGAAHAAQIGRDADLRRTGWYADQPGLAPDTVSGGRFGQRFSTPVNGAVYAQPLIFAGTLFVATEGNWIYGLDPITGAIRWSRNVATPWNASDVAGCTDLVPVVGITATPVIDDATGIAYFTAKTYHGAPPAAAWEMHAVAVATGAEQAGFPVTLQGVADNAPGQTFAPANENQRPGLLLLGGVVYAAFSSVCDTPPFQGWVLGVSTAGAITARWVDRSGSGTSGGGIWMSGSALVSDGPGQILLVTGNGGGGGTPASPIPGNAPPADLSEAVVRLSVQGNGSLTPIDFFTPHNASALLDPIDAETGSGGVVGLPYPPFGTAAVSNLYVQAGKQGIVYLLNGNSLGGCQQGAGGGDQVIQEIGPYGGVWSKPAVWGGDGGWVFIPTADTTLSGDADYGFLRAYQAGVDGAGNPTLTLAASSSDRFGFSSSAPVVTSQGSTSGSALLWIVWNPDRTGNGAELRAYDVPPAGGALTLRFHAPVGQGSKFNPPGVSGNRLYVGTRDGYVIGFGLPAAGAPPAPATRLGAPRPNPFADATTVDVTLASRGPATLAVFDLGGRRVRRLLEGDLAAGSQPVVWDGRDDQGVNVRPGLYLMRLDVQGIEQARRVVRIR